METPSHVWFFFWFVCFCIFNNIDTSVPMACTSYITELIQTRQPCLQAAENVNQYPPQVPAQRPFFAEKNISMRNQITLQLPFHSDFKKLRQGRSDISYFTFLTMATHTHTQCFHFDQLFSSHMMQEISNVIKFECNTFLVQFGFSNFCFVLLRFYIFVICCSVPK